MTLGAPNSTHVRGCWGISSSCCCVRNYRKTQWHKTITALCSQILWVRIQTGPSRNSFSLLHNTWESAGKVCRGLGSTWGCVPDAHIWLLPGTSLLWPPHVACASSHHGSLGVWLVFVAAQGCKGECPVTKEEAGGGVLSDPTSKALQCHFCLKLFVQVSHKHSPHLGNVGGEFSIPHLAPRNLGWLSSPSPLPQTSDCAYNSKVERGSVLRSLGSS